MPNYRYQSSGCMGSGMRQPNALQQGQCGVNESGSGKYGSSDRMLCNLPVAMAYVPWSEWENIYEVEKGFQRGTIFRALDKPFRGIGGCQNAR